MKPCNMPLGHFPRLKVKTARYHVSRCDIELIVIHLDGRWMRYLPILQSLRPRKPLRYPDNGLYDTIIITIKYIIIHLAPVSTAKYPSE